MILFYLHSYFEDETITTAKLTDFPSTHRKQPSIEILWLALFLKCFHKIITKKKVMFTVTAREIPTAERKPPTFQCFNTVQTYFSFTIGQGEYS